MKNNKAFTLVEMLVSFTLSMILVIIMFQLIINLKDVYMTSGIKTEMINKQYLMTNKIYKDLTEKKLTGISKCENDQQNCINISFSTGETKTFSVDLVNNTLNYDNYVQKVTNNSTIGTITINCNAITETKKILTIKVPITNSNFKDTDFGINIVYPFNTVEVTDTYNEV